MSNSDGEDMSLAPAAAWGRAGTHYEGLKLKNMGEKDFFEKSPYFKKTKEGLYYFQLYKDAGKIYENNTCKCEN